MDLKTQSRYTGRGLSKEDTAGEVGVSTKINTKGRLGEETWKDPNQTTNHACTHQTAQYSR